MKVVIHCTKRGCPGKGNDIMTDDDPVTRASQCYCKRCGTKLGSYGALVDGAMQAAKKHIDPDGIIDWKS